jgi:Fe2+ or Zn2+ uptake regulation protein
MTSSSDEQTLIVLRAQGRRITPQRKLLLEIIRQGEGHLDADEIYRRAREQDPEDHYHLICSKCERVVEFHSPLVGKLMDQISGDNDFLIERVHIDLVGLCGDCGGRKGG